jgi:hypothetical protein
MDGVFSMKSDVYSFGVLVLEIIAGKRNGGFYEEELDLNLLRYVSSREQRFATVAVFFFAEYTCSITVCHDTFRHGCCGKKAGPSTCWTT